MITVTQLRAGVCFLDQGEPWRVMTYKHTHMSRGSGTIRIKCRHLRSGRVLQKTFKSGEKVEDIDVSKRPLQFLYKDQEGYVFMDDISFEQTTIPSEILGDDGAYLKEGESVSVIIWDEEALGVELPPKMTFVVSEAAPGEKGDSASNVYKDAVLENGLKIRVPLFVNAGERIRVDTRDGTYIERAAGVV